jgi:probable HAF family extracellular repeat protein
MPVIAPGRAFAAATLSLAASLAGAQAHYTATLVAGPEGQHASATAIGPSGAVTGTMTPRLRPHWLRSFVQQGASFVSFKPMGLTDSVGNGVSSAGDVAGYMSAPGSSLEQGYVRRADGTVRRIQVVDAGSEVPTHPIAVNASGTVAGRYLDHAFYNDIAFVWRDGVVTALPSTLGGVQSEIDAINDAGQMVGHADVARYVHHAASWSPDGTLTDLGTLEPDGTSQANAIAANGWIAGSASVAGGQSWHACLWRDGGIVDLGTLPGDMWSVASGINAHGDVVGSGGPTVTTGHPVLWHDGQALDLTAVTTVPAGTSMTTGMGIADDGTILVQGRDAQGLFVELLLTPDAR